MTRTPRPIYVWDLPIRLFHWLLAALVAFQWASAEIGGALMDYHKLGGYAVLTLVLFRLLWGFLGSEFALFSSFMRGIGPTLEYVRSLRAGASPRYLGHNPLGGWMTLAFLLSLSTQAVTGLFANDDVTTEGPLAHLVAKRASDVLGEIHQGAFTVLLVLVVLHVGAVLTHRVVKGENLVRPMITGYKEDDQERTVRTASPWLALALLLGTAGAVAALVNLGG